MGLPRNPQPPVQTCYYPPNTAPPPLNSLPVFQAQAVTLTVAQAFKVAFEFWQVSKEGEPCSQTLCVGGSEEGALKKAGRVLWAGEGVMEAWTDSHLHHLPSL